MMHHAVVDGEPCIIGHRVVKAYHPVRLLVLQERNVKTDCRVYTANSKIRINHLEPGRKADTRQELC